MISGENEKTVPAHIAIVMDGNGRWAARRGMPRPYGHKEGVQTVRRIVRHVAGLGVQYLTLYSFSTENWSRPKDEINALFGLLKTFVAKDLSDLAKEGVRVHVLGRKDNLPEDIARIIAQVEENTAHNTDFHLNIAFNYGGRDEIVRAAKRLARAVKAGDLTLEKLDSDQFSTMMDTGTMPDPELIIRTGGEHRISNFLLWQAAYAEFVVMDELWPDFSESDLDKALDIYACRERRFGGVPQV